MVCASELLCVQSSGQVISEIHGSLASREGLFGDAWGSHGPWRGSWTKSSLSPGLSQLLVWGCQK